MRKGGAVRLKDALQLAIVVVLGATFAVLYVGVAELHNASLIKAGLASMAAVVVAAILTY